MKPLTIIALSAFLIGVATALRSDLFWRELAVAIYGAACLLAWECIAIQRERRK